MFWGYLNIAWWLLVVVVAILAWPLLLGGAPFLPSYRKKDTDKNGFREVVDYLKKEGVKNIVDLGSGDGRVVIDMAEAGFKSYGLEINPLLILVSRYKIKKAGLNDKAKIIWKNFWQYDLNKFEAIWLFQFETANKKIVKKLNDELKPGTIIISVGFQLSEDFEFIRREGGFFVYKKLRE